MPHLEWTETPRSSNVSRFAYIEARGELIVQFSSTAPAYYVYEGVTPEEHEQAKREFSIGKFLAEKIKPVKNVRRIESGDLAALLGDSSNPSDLDKLTFEQLANHHAAGGGKHR